MLLVATLVGLTACTTDQVDPGSHLELADAQPEHVAGSFSKDGTRLDFEITKSALSRHIVLRDGDGASLLDSTFANDIDTATVLSRLTLIGAPLSSVVVGHLKPANRPTVIVPQQTAKPSSRNLARGRNVI